MAWSPPFRSLRERSGLTNVITRALCCQPIIWTNNPTTPGSVIRKRLHPVILLTPHELFSARETRASSSFILNALAWPWILTGVNHLKEDGPGFVRGR